MRSGTKLALVYLATMLAIGGCDTEYVFDDVSIGSDGDGREARPRSNSQFIRSVYADLLGRTPGSYDFVIYAGADEAGRFRIDEQSFLLAALDAIGDYQPVRNLLIAGLVESAELDIPRKAEVVDPEAYVTDQFRRYLGRDPGVYELRTFVDEWRRDPAVNPKTVIRALLGSREYQSY